MPSNEITPLLDVPATVAEVKKYFNDPTRRLWFHTVSVPAAIAAKLAAAVPSYDDYRGAQAAKTILKIASPEVTGEMLVTFRFSREYKPTLYVDLPVPPGDTTEYMQIVRNIITTLKADKGRPGEVGYYPEENAVRASWC